MAKKIKSNILVYTFTEDKIRSLKNVLTYYVLIHNSNLSQKLGRSLKPDEKFSPTPEFAEILQIFDVEPAHWRLTK